MRFADPADPNTSAACKQLCTRQLPIIERLSSSLVPRNRGCQVFRPGLISDSQ